MFQIQHLSVEFSSSKKTFPILKDINLSVEEGEFVALVGESGSGKTMTALSTMHLLPDSIRITDGNIFLDDREISSLRDKEFRRFAGKDISMIFQEPMTSLNPIMKVGKQIEESGIVHGLSKSEAKKRCEKLAVGMGLEDSERILNSYPHELSGGMKQRIMIASALMNNPRLLIADEPTTALDLSTQEEIISILKGLNKRKNLSMLLITHDLSVVKKLCSRVYIMYKGEIVEEASVEEIFKNPGHEYSRALVNSIDSLKSREKKLPIYHDFILEGMDRV
ncbi:MAG: ABC transporter ATP-binding protein [Treponema sp.]|nr:ABC transporter ATP-binding protein [Treponema sp.]